jgi:hypothetical protein
VLSQASAHTPPVINGKASSSTGPREGGEINGLEITLGIVEAIQ